MVLKKRVVTPIAFAWTFTAACMATVALSAPPPGQEVEDVQIGERNNQTRIALLCTEACSLTKRGDDVFLLHGANADFSLDLSERSQNVFELVAVSAGGGSLIRVTPNYAIEHANTKNCNVGGRAAACIDLFFDLPTELSVKPVVEKPSPPAREASAPPQPLREAPAQEPKPKPKPKQIAQKPALKEPEPQKSAPEQITPEKTVIAKPSLREGAPERMTVFARLTPPERLTPPSGAVLAKVQPIERTVDIRKPAIRTDEVIEPPRFDYAERVAILLKKNLSSAYCNNAEATLQADAWAMGAMVDAGLCAAARGDLAEADAMLARILEFTPDNYEALVGRALIAVQANEKSVARKYFQDALNALPPIDESKRIVAEMASL